MRLSINNFIHANVLFRILILNPQLLDCDNCALSVAMMAPSLREAKLVVDGLLMLFCAGPRRTLIDATFVIAAVELGTYLLVRVVLSLIWDV